MRQNRQFTIVTQSVVYVTTHAVTGRGKIQVSGGEPLNDYSGDDAGITEIPVIRLSLLLFFYKGRGNE
ncbi:TPA_asm: hypothetical protein GNB58_005002 [Salmonella enterica subsp. houtenae serovar 45:g,z51:-]|uniref:Uncharacterized protein n=1 Tax=Salmonella enterica subsp. houtenae serovar 45:g,z51:- TaxID=1967611 RepID=A0A736VMB1_SALHO|nr:hypothetical protein [Salmonella enterica subsp. houtenae str. CFSAN000557]HAE7767866.1 hypothetical protein [Salmonella enterica subsp. houtenae serovar 45:g,z51:-]